MNSTITQSTPVSSTIKWGTHLYRAAVSPIFRISGWIPYELIFTMLPHLLPRAFEFTGEKVEVTDLDKTTQKNIVSRVNELKQYVYIGSNSRAPDIQIKVGDNKPLDNLVYSIGGARSSLQTPTIVLPRNCGLVQSELSEDLNLDDSVIFNKEETVFLVTKEILRIKHEAGLIRIVALSALFGLATTLYFLAVPTIAAAIISWSAYVLVFTSYQHRLEKQINVEAHLILKKLYQKNSKEETEKHAYEVMHNTYRKMQLHNQQKRENSRFGWRKLYIMESGNNYWDWWSRPNVSELVKEYGEAAGKNPLVFDDDGLVFV